MYADEDLVEVIVKDYKDDNVWLMHGDCLERMKEIPDGSVDAVICDPPYGTIRGAGLDGWTDGKTDWDSTIETSAMLEQCNRILRTNGALVLFSQEPYTSSFR